jgi:hypothetical protein
MIDALAIIAIAAAILILSDLRESFRDTLQSDGDSLTQGDF